MPSAHSPARVKSCTMSGGTLIASRSRTIGWSTSTTARFVFAGRTTGLTPSRRHPLVATEFIRRFLLHVLPAGFQRIRYYGLLGNRHSTEKLARCRQLLGMTPRSEPSLSHTTGVPDYRDRVDVLTGVSLRMCPICHEGEMVAIVVVPDRIRPLVADTAGSHPCPRGFSLVAPTRPRGEGPRIASPLRHRSHDPSRRARRGSSAPVLMLCRGPKRAPSRRWRPRPTSIQTP
jgi:hypothetical protein